MRFGFAVLDIFDRTFQGSLPNRFETKRNGPLKTPICSVAWPSVSSECFLLLEKILVSSLFRF